MFEKTSEELHEIGGYNTTVEIKQQPELWLDTLNIYRENLEAIESFLADARAMGEGRLSVVFTGAAPPTTSATPAPPTSVTRGDTKLYDFKPIATTDIVSAPATS